MFIKSFKIVSRWVNFKSILTLTNIHEFIRTNYSRRLILFDLQKADSSSSSDSSDSDESPERKGGLQSANQLLEKLAKMKEFAEKKRKEKVKLAHKINYDEER